MLTEEEGSDFTVLPDSVAVLPLLDEGLASEEASEGLFSKTEK